jgi:hypothetical protein
MGCVFLWKLFLCSEQYHDIERFIPSYILRSIMALSDIFLLSGFVNDSMSSYSLFFIYLYFLVHLRGRKAYEPPRYMTINTAIDQLLEIAQAHEEAGEFF